MSTDLASSKVSDDIYTYLSFENERLTLQQVTMIIRFARCDISTVGNEHNTLIYGYLVKKLSYTNGVFPIIEEVIRIVNKLKKVIAKTLLYVVLVDSDEFLRQTFDLIWTKNVKFAKKFFLERTQMADELMA